MLYVDLVCEDFCGIQFSDGIHPIFCNFSRLLCIYNGRGVPLRSFCVSWHFFHVADKDGDFLLHCQGHFARFVYVVRGDISQLRYVLPNKQPPRILVDPLLRHIVHPHCIDPRRPCLHLQLWIVYARFVIQKNPREVWCNALPVQPKVKGGERYEHRPRTKIEPAVFQQTPHTSVDVRITRGAHRPRRVVGVVPIARPPAQVSKGGTYV
mmetsp:Transcript_32988/g.51082  ORF Transcript_32988/g.51082 Transcript_32988/m.51082 type:complete len:209 (-) Transcript_32988:321-947(-)